MHVTATIYVYSSSKRALQRLISNLAALCIPTTFFSPSLLLFYFVLVVFFSYVPLYKRTFLTYSVSRVSSNNRRVTFQWEDCHTIVVACICWISAWQDNTRLELAKWGVLVLRLDSAAQLGKFIFLRRFNSLLTLAHKNIFWGLTKKFLSKTVKDRKAGVGTY